LNLSLTAHRRRVPGVRVLVAAAIAAAVLAAAMPAVRESRAFGATAACTPDAAWPGANATLAQQVVDLENARRASLGLAALTVDATLTDAAVWKARFMAQTGVFGHDDQAPISRDAHTRSLDCGYAANAAWGENIAYGQSSPSAVMTAWINSEGHRENLDNPSFGAIGVGVAADSAGRIYWVQDFGSAVVTPGAPPPAPPPPPPPPPPAPPAPPPPAAPPAPPKSSTPVLPPAKSAEPSATEPAEAIGNAIAESSHESTPAARKHRKRTTRLHAVKPHAGDAYTVRMSFGRVPVATSALAVRCHAKLSGKRLEGTGEIAGHVASCTWQIPEGAGGDHLHARVKISGRHGVSLVRSARLIVAS
jgi:uncharacterized protein YkwD